MKIAGKHSSEGVAGFGDLKLIPILQIVWLEQRAVQAMGQGCRITESEGKDLNPGSRDAEPTILTHCAHPLHCLSTCPWGHQGSEDKGNTRQEHSDALGPEAPPGRASRHCSLMLLQVSLYHRGCPNWWPIFTGQPGIMEEKTKHFRLLFTKAGKCTIYWYFWNIWVKGQTLSKPESQLCSLCYHLPMPEQRSMRTCAQAPSTLPGTTVFWSWREKHTP